MFHRRLERGFRHTGRAIRDGGEVDVLARNGGLVAANDEGEGRQSSRAREGVAFRDTLKDAIELHATYAR